MPQHMRLGAVTFSVLVVESLYSLWALEANNLISHTLLLLPLSLKRDGGTA